MTFSSEPGQIGWIDLTVSDAEAVRDFYSRVTGWRHSAVDMGSHQDYNMLRPGTEEPLVGICHALGQNSDLPPQWLIYINVTDLDAAIEAVKEGSGSIILGPMGERPAMRYAVARDPAGAAFALVEHGSE